MSFTSYVCWKSEDAARLLATEALAGDDALFLATHLPIRGFELEGSQRAFVDAPTEQGLLDALLRKESRHAFCVIEGQPGSGKSHLIRWLNVRWPRDGAHDLVLLVQRADGSLEGTLSQLKARLPDTYRPIFEGIGPTTKVAEEGRRRDFLTKLANSMQLDYFDKQPADAEWCSQHALSRILMHEKVLELWGAPRRILQIIGGKRADGGNRDQELARFTMRDVLDIAQMSRDIRAVPLAAVHWLRALSKESEQIQAAIAAGADPDPASDTFDKFPEAHRLLSALELRLNNAIQELLGSSARQLDELFKHLRRRLKSEGRRLVLLLEDVTNFQGVDEKLIDALVLNADTDAQAEYCDLISVLGVTPDYFRRYIETKSNYYQRITHHVRLSSGDGQTLGAGSDDAEYAPEFAARYLRAVRAGVERLAHSDGDGEVFNRCATCEHRTVCHEAFGQHGDVGLYPFTARAVREMFANLQDPSNSMTQRTPRGLIQNILNPTLHAPDKLATGQYPHAGIETRFLARRGLDGPVRALIEARGGVHEEQLRRLIAWWGESGQRTTVSDGRQVGTLFHGLPEEIFLAFGLPWLGVDTGTAESAAAVNPITAPAVTPPVQAVVSVRVGPAADQPHQQTGGRPTPTLAGAPLPVARSTVSPNDLKNRREQLDRWFEGVGRLEEPEKWNRSLYQLMTREFPWRRLGISPWLQATFFTESRVMIAGTKRSDNMFVVPKEQWFRYGLEAFLVLQAAIALTAADADFYRYRLSRCIRKLEGEVTRYIRSALGEVDGRSWSPVGLVVQIALARSWLRGTLRPGQPLADQWAYLHSPEPSADAAPKKRVDSWRSLLGKTDHLPSQFELRFSHMVNQPQGYVTPGQYGVCQLGMADPSDAIEPMSALIDTMQLSKYPASGTMKDQFLQNLLKVSEEFAQLPHIPAREGRRLKDVVDALDEVCPSESIEEFARRVDAVVRQIEVIAPGAPNAAIQGWTTMYAELNGRGFLAQANRDRVQRIDDFRTDAEDKSPEDFTSPTSLLNWCIGAPADDLQAAYEMVKKATGVVNTLSTYVDSVLRDAGIAEGATLPDIQRAGVELTSACADLLTQFPEEK